MVEARGAKSHKKEVIKVIVANVATTLAKTWTARWGETLTAREPTNSGGD